MVIEQVQNLDFRCVGQEPVGGVGLPHFIGQLSLEANPGGFGALVWLGAIRPLDLRIRQMVGREGAVPKRSLRW